MNLHSVIIHELNKEAKKTEVSTFLSDSALPINETTISLVKKLNDSYRKDKIINAAFNNHEDDIFPKQYGIYHDAGKSEEEFIKFSRLSLVILKSQIQNVFLAKGGFFVYADYTVNNQRYTGIYLVRDNDGMLFKKNPTNGNFDIDSIKYMNTDKLAMGCRVNNSKYEVRLGRYLTLINNNQSDISEYFSNWVCITQPESSTECTNQLYALVNAIDLPLDPRTNTSYDLDTFRKLVVDYVRTQPNKIVNLKEMSLHFYRDENKIIDYLDTNNITLDHEFKVDNRALNKFTKLEINSDGIQMKFARGDYNRRKIKISEDNPNLVLIESAQFAEALRREIQTLPV